MHSVILNVFIFWTDMNKYNPPPTAIDLTHQNNIEFDEKRDLPALTFIPLPANEIVDKEDVMME